MEIRNIYRSRITTLIGTLFGLADLAYIFVKESPDWKILTTIAVISFIFLFMSDAMAKKWLDKASGRL